jgi:two-component system, cell cycle response regulator
MPYQNAVSPTPDASPDAMLTSSRLSGFHAEPTILVVDDDHAARIFLEHVLKERGYQVLLASSGEDALKALDASSQHISAVVMDLHMPGIDGFEVIAQMKAQPEMAYIPVIMATASERPELVKNAVEAGVYYCLQKPLDQSLLNSVVEAVIREFDITRMRHEAIAGHRSAMSLMDTSRFFCKTLKDVEVLAQFLAGAYPDPKRAIIGITELLINGVEHGNLGISYEEKQQLVKSGTWREVIDARQQMPEHVHKNVDIVLQQKPEGVFLQVSDEGKGFEWWRYLEIDPSRATHPNGRGIALANKISFDRLQFTQDGSRVLAVVETDTAGRHQGKTLNW